MLRAGFVQLGTEPVEVPLQLVGAYGYVVAELDRAPDRPVPTWLKRLPSLS
jgi:hypothetical protein